MAKLILQPKPTFDAKVMIPVPGAGFEAVNFTFKHRTRTELQTFVKGLGDHDSDAAMVMDIASGWELADSFNLTNVEALAENYIAAPGAILETYLDQLARNREKK